MEAKSVKINTRLKPTEDQQLREEAQRRDITVSACARRLIVEWFDYRTQELTQSPKVTS